VSPQAFEEQLAAFRRYGPCFSLGEMLSLEREKRLPRRAIAVTFDDGYADNLHTAKPLFEKHGVPATMFLAAGLLGRAQEFWWDELERLIIEPEHLPDHLSLPIGPQVQSWRLGPAATLTTEERHRSFGWKAWQAPPTPRFGLYLDLWAKLLPLPPEFVSPALEYLAEWAGVRPGMRDSHRPMTTDEARVLAQGSFIEIGAHSMTHPSLPTLPADRQREEIERSRDFCTAVSGRPVVCFSYPYGHNSPLTMDLVREAGFRAACSTRAGALSSRSDPLDLPRVQALDWGRGELMPQLLKAARSS
jgi:peptidoglycan/xylan/chitin deacetylase (PgdA/CDA1 family)